MNKIKIAIADDHHLVIEGLKTLLQGKGHEVTITADNGAALIMEIMNSSVIPDVCVIDGNMPVMAGSDTTKALINRWPKMKIIAFSMDEMTGKDMLNKGASAFVEKNNIETLSDTIERIVGAA